MKFSVRYSMAVLGILASPLISGCEKTTKTNSDAIVVREDSTITFSSRAAQRELEDLRTLVKTKTATADSSFKENWPEFKDKFKTHSAKLETRLDSLSSESKQEYAELKRKYEIWEAQNEARTAQPLSEKELVTWRKELLGDRNNLETVTAENIRETYLLFMGIVRAKNRNWTQENWDYVDNVYGQLNDRKRQIDNKISAADRLKIKTLQAEYLALEAKSDAASAYKHMKE